MPQLDAYTFATQALWFLVCFFSLFLLTFETFLPRLLEIMVFRSSKLAQLSGSHGATGSAGMMGVSNQLFEGLQGATQALLSQLGSPGRTISHSAPASLGETPLAVEELLLHRICAEALPLLRASSKN